MCVDFERGLRADVLLGRDRREAAGRIRARPDPRRRTRADRSGPSCSPRAHWLTAHRGRARLRLCEAAGSPRCLQNVPRFAIGGAVCFAVVLAVIRSGLTAPTPKRRTGFGRSLRPEERYRLRHRAAPGRRLPPIAIRISPAISSERDQRKLSFRTRPLRPALPRRRHDHRRALVASSLDLREASLELEHELVHRQPVLRVLRHRALDREIEPHGTVGPAIEHARRRLVHVPHRNRDEVVARERHLARQELVQNDAERVDVRLRVDLLAARLLRARCSRSSRARCPSGSRRARRASGRSRSRSPSPGPRRSGGRSAASRPGGRGRARARTTAPARSGARARSPRAPRAGLRFDSSFRFSPSMYSKTMNWRPSCSPRSMTVTMFGWESCATARASRRNRST